MSIFVDTGAWYASVIPADPYHRRVVDILRHNPLPLVTTDYIVDETLTLLRVRGESAKAIAFGRHFFDLKVTNVLHLTPENLLNAWQLFRDQPLRHWSFTDCTSKVVMEERHIHRALSLDRHFEEFGSIQVLP